MFVKQINMNKFQELLNAFSILAPSITLLYINNNYSLDTIAFITTTILHNMSSFTYHMLCYYDYFEDKINNNYRKLDQSMIHVSSIIYSCVILQDYYYGLLMLLLNTNYIYRLWFFNDNALNRRLNICKSMILYLSPIIYNKHYIYFFRAIFYIILFILSFHFNYLFYGYGHFISHLFLAPYVYVLYNYIIKN